jgi:hypothetical protein
LLQVKPRDLRAADHRSLDNGYRIVEFRGHEIPRVIAWRSNANSRGVVALGRRAALCSRGEKSVPFIPLGFGAVRSSRCFKFRQKAVSERRIRTCGDETSAVRGRT